MRRLQEEVMAGSGPSNWMGQVSSVSESAPARLAGLLGPKTDA